MQFQGYVHPSEKWLTHKLNVVQHIKIPIFTNVTKIKNVDLEIYDL